MGVVKKEFGKNSKGEQAYFYEITNTAGMKAEAPELVAKYEELKAKYTAKIPNEKRTTRCLVYYNSSILTW